MRWMKRKQRVDGTYRRGRNFERERAVQALVSMLLFLLVGILLSLALSPESAKVLEEFACKPFDLCDSRQ